METVTPLATALDLPINDGFDDTEIKKLANAILTELAFAGKIVLVCWHHGKIPDIAKALGIKRPPKWDAKVFDRVWQITFPKGKAALQDSPFRPLGSVFKRAPGAPFLPASWLKCFTPGSHSN